MRLKDFSKKIIAYSCVCALAVSGMVGFDVTKTSANSLTVSSLPGTYGTAEGSDYLYQTYVGCDASSEYNYLEISYSGDATALNEVRWEFRDSEDFTIGTYWFVENAQGTFKTVDDTLVPAPTSETQTVVIDLEKSGIDNTNGISAFHFHNTQGTGTVTFSSARFLKVYPDTGETPSEEPSTEAPVEMVFEPAIADELFNPYGDWTIYLGNWGGQTADVAVDPTDASHIQIKPTASLWYDAWSLQAQYKVTGLVPNSEFTIELDVTPSRVDGKFKTDIDDTLTEFTSLDTIHVVKTATADAEGNAILTFGFGWVGLDVILDLDNVEFTGTKVPNTDDIVLNGDENGASAMMGTYTAPGRVPTDDYKYLGFATLKDATENHKYLVLTYTGNITQLRFEFVSMEDGSETGKIGPFWFNPEGQEKFFVTADGSAIPLVGDATTVVIDLEASGIDMATYNDGVHMHCDLMATNGDFEIGYARLSTTAEVKDVDQMPSQGGNEDPTTEAPTTEPTTEEPTTVDDKEEETTKKLTLKRVKKVKATKKAGAKKAKISFKKVKGAKKYQIQISTKKNFKKVIYKKTVKKTSVNIKTKKIKKNRKYYVRVRAINKSKNVTGKWSKVKKIKVKK